MKQVLITGATKGIGFEIAKFFYEKGYALILNSSNMENLKETKEKLFADNPITLIESDLSTENGGEELYKKIRERGLQVDALINNAGIGFVGSDMDISLEKEYKMINLNMKSPLTLTKLFLTEMTKRDSGMILNVASIGAYQPGPYTTTYYATKSFLLNYTLGIKQELKTNNINISVLCPGSTKTEFFTKAGQDTPNNAMNPRRVAIYAYHGLMKNNDIIIPGIGNKLTRIVPSRIKSQIIKRMKEKAKK